jgi:hypothetical protein
VNLSYNYLTAKTLELDSTEITDTASPSFGCGFLFGVGSSFGSGANTGSSSIG